MALIYDPIVTYKGTEGLQTQPRRQGLGRFTFATTEG